MSGSTIGGVVGGIIGFVVSGYNPAGFQYGFMIGSMIGGYVDPEKVQGPKLNDAMRTTYQDGIPIPFGYGTFPVGGNVIWNDLVVEHENEERTGKGGGPVQVTYTYTTSYAMGICEGPITGLLIVKRNGKLVYDARTEAELTAIGYTSDQIAETRAAQAKWLENITIYLGDETQLADPTIEAVEGVGNVSAFRGLAYFVATDEDVTDTSGAIPQYEIVVVGSGTVSDYIPTVATPLAWWKLDDAITGTAADSSGNGYDGTYIGGYETAAAILAGSTGSTRWLDTTGGVYVPYAVPLGIGEDGSFSVETTFICESTSGGSVSKNLVTGWGSAQFGYANFVTCLAGTNNMMPLGGYTKANLTGCLVTGSSEVSTSVSYHMVFSKGAAGEFLYLNNALIASGTDACAIATGAGIARALSVDGIRIGSGGLYSSSYGFIGKQENVCIYDSALSATQVSGLYNARWLNGTSIPDAPGWVIGSDGVIYGSPGAVTLIDPGTVTLDTIVANVFSREGLAADQYDVTALAGITVKGFRVASEGGADTILAPLMAGFFFDIVEYDGKLRCVLRGGAATFALTSDDLVARDAEAFEQTRVQEAELLRKVTVGYIDPAATYAITTQAWERRAGTVRAKGEQSFALPITMAADDAAQAAEKRGKTAWGEPNKYKFTLPVSKTALTPGDVGTYTTKAGDVLTIRLMGREEEGGKIMFEAAQNEQAAYTGTATGVTVPLPTPAPPPLVGPMVAYPLDIRPLRDIDDRVGFYLVAGGVLSGWNGGVVDVSHDGGLTYPTQATFTQGSKIGTITEAIAAGSPYAYETTTSFTVTLNDTTRTLSSCTFDQLMTEANAFAIIDADGTVEVCQFSTATLVSAGVYTISGYFIRGRVGTAAGAHAAGSTFVLLDQVVFVEVDRALIGQTLTLRPVGFGTSSDAATTQAFAFDCMAQTELAPMGFVGTRDGSNNVTVSWQGVGRLGSAYNASHGRYCTGYRVDFSDGVTTVSKTTTAQTYTYTAADQTTDFGSLPAGPLAITVYQINTITGTGDQLAAAA